MRHAVHTPSRGGAGGRASTASMRVLLRGDPAHYASLAGVCLAGGVQDNTGPPVRRRLLLALGALALLDGCAHPATATWHGGPTHSDLPGDPPPQPSPSGPSPSAAPSWQIPTPANATPRGV